MHTSAALLDIHERSHRSLIQLLAHCRKLSHEELYCKWDGFGYPTVHLQLHHEIAAQKYWIGVLEGRIDVDENLADYPTVKSLEDFRTQVFVLTEEFLHTVSAEELNTARPVMTWGNRKQVLSPVQVILRTQMHLYHHQGQILAMCRLMGKACNGLDYPIA
jgi:uncharacterized damage-inducible protein DinB